jgi:hypothetical protein
MNITKVIASAKGGLSDGYSEDGNGDQSSSIPRSDEAASHVEWTKTDHSALDRLHQLNTRWRRATLLELFDRVKKHVHASKLHHLPSWAAANQELMAQAHFAFNSHFQGFVRMN